MFPKITVAAALLLVGCGTGAAPADPPLAGARIGGPFALTNQDGRTVRDTDFAGKYRLVYFGYTFCPDVCPVDVQKLGALMRDLDKTDPALSARIVPIFITVDPERDTPAAIKQFVTAFHPRIVGLTGTPQAIAAVAKAYGVSYGKEPPGPGGGYLVNHMTLTYLMGPKGEPIAYLSRDMTVAQMADEVRKWTK
jgi:protein SCO1/2